MKAFARMFVWWINMDKDIEQMVKQCSQCQQVRPSPPVAPLHPWQWPIRPWARIHLDFAGPVQGKMLLVAVDAHSKWIEVQTMSTTTAAATIEQLRVMFARWGIPETIVSDNGPQFVAQEFKQFCKLNGVKQVLVAPYHPSSNGLAERAVKTIKEGIRKMSEGSLLDKVSRFLFHYRLTPQSTTGKAPAELMMGCRIPRSRLDLVQPCLQERVHTKQQKQKQVHDKHSRERAFQEGERVYVKNYRGSGTQWWLPGKIVSITGPVSAIVELADGTRVRKHFDQIRKREAEMVEHSGDEQSFELETESCTDVGDNLESSAEALESNDDPESVVREPEPFHQLPPPSTRKTYPRRSRKPPDYLGTTS